MLTTLPSILAVSILAAFSLPKQTSAQEVLPNLSGTYRCEPDPVSCKDWGHIFTLNQTGAKFDVKSDEGHVAAGYLTSNISVSLGPPWNTLGIILPDTKTIEWSAGRKWRKE